MTFCVALTSKSCFALIFFGPASCILLKQLLLFLLISWSHSQQPIQPLASSAIDSEPIGAQGITIIVINQDFNLAKRALRLVDSWSNAPDQIQMAPIQ